MAKTKGEPQEKIVPDIRIRIREEFSAEEELLSAQEEGESQAAGKRDAPHQIDGQECEVIHSRGDLGPVPSRKPLLRTRGEETALRHLMLFAYVLAFSLGAVLGALQ
jgi:hypothetical protein